MAKVSSAPPIIKELIIKIEVLNIPDVLFSNALKPKNEAIIGIP